MITSSEVLGSDSTLVDFSGASEPPRGRSGRRGTEAERLAIGRQVGKYVIETVIGRGGMGTVYQAKHVELESRVAIKVLDPRYSASPEIVTRFFHEAKAAAQIGHPNIVQVLDFSRNTEVGDYIVMELLQGATLGDVLDRTPQLKEGRVVRMALQMCDALGAAHKLGIIHRDLKPANVFLSALQGKETVTLMDFGVAKIAEARHILETLPGAVMGTPQYMSPEQWDGKDVDGRSDIYSLGVVLYEALTGKLPFPGKTFAEIVKVQATVPVKPPREIRRDLLPELDVLVLRCLEMDPDLRYKTMEELAEHLRLARDGLLRARSGDGEPTIRLLRKGARKASKLIWIPPILALLLIAGVVWIVAARLGRNEREAAASLPTFAAAPPPTPTHATATEAAAVPASRVVNAPSAATSATPSAEPQAVASTRAPAPAAKASPPASPSAAASTRRAAAPPKKTDLLFSE